MSAGIPLYNQVTRSFQTTFTYGTVSPIESTAVAFFCTRGRFAISVQDVGAGSTFSFTVRGGSFQPWNSANQNGYYFEPSSGTNCTSVDASATVNTMVINDSTTNKRYTFTFPTTAFQRPTVSKSSGGALTGNVILTVSDVYTMQ